jgi:hypothetical protein
MVELEVDCGVGWDFWGIEEGCLRSVLGLKAGSWIIHSIKSVIALGKRGVNERI